MKTVKTGIVNGWVSKVVDCGYLVAHGAHRYEASLHPPVSEECLRLYKEDNDAANFIERTELLHGKVVWKKGERFGYFSSAEIAQQVVEKAAQMRHFQQGVDVHAVNKFLSASGFAAHSTEEKKE